MKIDIWVKETIEIADDAVFELANDDRELGQEPPESPVYFEAILNRAFGKGYLDEPESEWYVHDDFSYPVTDKEIQEIINEEGR